MPVNNTYLIFPRNSLVDLLAKGTEKPSAATSRAARRRCKRFDRRWFHSEINLRLSANQKKHYKKGQTSWRIFIIAFYEFSVTKSYKPHIAYPVSSLLSSRNNCSKEFI
jgi:hypothetical protein